MMFPSFVNMTAPAGYSGLYGPQLYQAQQRADALRQQVADPISAVTDGNGTQAPISWGSVLAKALTGVRAGQANQQLRTLQQQAGITPEQG